MCDRIGKSEPLCVAKTPSGDYFSLFKLWRRSGDLLLFLTRVRVIQNAHAVVCTENLNPHVIAMKSAKDGVRHGALTLGDSFG
jgi:hypothetical protein